MTIEELIALKEKIQNNTSTIEEELELLKFLNESIEDLKKSLRAKNDSDKIEDIKNSILNS